MDRLILDEQAQEKLQYLLKRLAGTQGAEKLMQALTDDNVSMKSFKKIANQEAGIIMPADPRAEKYKDIHLYSRMDLGKMLKEKFPKQMTVTFENMTVDNLRDYVKHGYIGMDLTASIKNGGVMQEDKLDIKKNLMPEVEGYNVWPDSGYDDDELEEWINDTLQEAQLPDIFRKDAECTRLVEQHPDLMDAKLWFDGEDEDIVENMTVEGRPFEDALKIVSQNPGITTMDMKARLQELNKLDMDRTGWHKTENRITDILLKENHKGHQIVRCKIDGEQQVFHPLTKQQSNDLSMISDKDLRKAFLIDVLRDVYKDKLSQQNQKETGLKI